MKLCGITYEQSGKICKHFWSAVAATLSQKHVPDPVVVEEI